MELTCRACSSKRVLRGAGLISPGFFGHPYPVIVRVPGGSALRGGAQSRVSAHVCVDCGAIQLQAQDLTTLRIAYEAIGQTLSLNA